MTPAISSIHLFEILNKYKDSPFIFVESGGNHGDFLIYRGAKKIFDIVGIKYRSVDHDEFLSMEIANDTVIYINGGGSFNDLWRQRPIDDFIKGINSCAKALILGPTTFTEKTDFLISRVFSKIGHITDKKVYLFCREEPSYLTVKRIVPAHFEVLIDHDTALNLSAEDLTNIIPKGKNILYAIREDKEQQNFERLNLFNLWIDPIKLCASFDDWIALHANAKKIVTNRLHSSILGTILGKSVTLLPNSYYKNRSVWEYSLKCKGVIWQNTIDISPLASILMRSKPYKWVGNSYKVKKFCKKLYGIE